MKLKKMVIFACLLVFLASVLPLEAESQLEIKLRVYEGTRQGSGNPPEFVTSSYIQPTITANLRLGFELEKEKAQIRKVFNLGGVNILTETELNFGAEKDDSVRHLFRLNSHAYEVYVLLKEWGAAGRFLVLVNELSLQDSSEKSNILTTEMLLQGGHSAVFGFEDRKGKPYFVSFVITGPKSKIIPLPPPPPPPPSPPADPEKIKEFEEGAVLAKNAVDPPKLLKRVDPVYPEEARRAKQSDLVILNVRTDESGSIERIMVLKGKYKYLNAAAIEAVKQWKYQPYLLDGEPKPVVFTVSVRFQFKEDQIDSIEAGGETVPPKVIHRVDPVYPEDARKAGVQGSVILYVTSDEKGKVTKVEVLKSISGLDQAAVDAVKQWVYEPYLHEGKAKPVSFAVTVQFILR